MARTVLNMDFSWKFHLGEIDMAVVNSHSSSYASCKAGAQIGPGGKTWADWNWREVNLPHDYYSESDFLPENLISHGYRTRNNAWYRKTFILDDSLRDKELILCFEGTAVNAEFYFNGSLMARSFSAYTETTFNVTDRAYFDGKPNVLSVHINGLQTEGWWYEGAGIYRHVKLYALDKVHIAHNGVFGKPVLKKGTKNSWTVEVETTLENSLSRDEKASVLAEIYDGDKLIASQLSTEQTIPFAAQKPVLQKLNVSRPVRWDVDNPYLYTLKCTVLRGGVAVDEVSHKIGFRTFHFDATKGFFLNDRPLKIMGTCNHQDHAGVGVAVPDSVQKFRIQRLKDMGTNAYRCSHNLPNKEILDYCDELGLLVMDENRRFESREEVLEYLDIMVKRDRNHPSVIMWSLFNEEPLQNTEEGAKIYRRMKNRVLHLDDSRILTGAINGSMEGAGMEMDVTGINYWLNKVPEMHALHPDQPMLGAENNSAVTTRGCYQTDRDKHVLANYDEETVPWGHTVKQTWDLVRKNDYFPGLFIWTGFDYRGEPTPFTWPSVSSQFGIMDTCGFAKDSFFFNKACFTHKPMVHLLPHWNWKKGDVVRVMAVSNCDEVELIVCGKSLGKKKDDVCAHAEWSVPFTPGKIVAKAYRNGKCVAKTEQRTAGKPYAIKITPFSDVIKNDGQDTAVLNFCVVDKRGVVVPHADNLLHFDVVGDGFVRGVGNGDPNSHESDVAPLRKLFAGWCQALITSNLGAKNITVRASGDGLIPAEICLNVQDVPAPSCPVACYNSALDGFTMSEVTAEKPDATRNIADNDMNSFEPVFFVKDCHQKDFKDGWRIYRVVLKMPQAGTFALSLPYARFKKMETYVNGELIHEADTPTNGLYVTPDFKAEKDQTLDIRFLMYMHGGDVWGAGISNGVDLVNRK